MQLAPERIARNRLKLSFLGLQYFDNQQMSK